MLTEEAVRTALEGVTYPGLNSDIIALGLVNDVAVRDGSVDVSLTVSTERADVPERLKAAIGGVLREAGAERWEVRILPPQRRARAADPWAGRRRLPGVRRVIAVGAGKGGVGKSTVAVNLALALRRTGLRVGLMDADIYGPSVPVLVGLEDGAKRIEVTAQKHIVPLDALGISVVSFGFFLGPGSPAVWRGPLVGKAVKQFSQGVRWPELDALVVDLPPGTGDVPLSLAQSVAVDGAVIVTTPQRLAVLEAGKAIEMFRKLAVPVLGVVENMSYADCECGRRSHPFGHGGGQRLSAEEGSPFLGSIPFEDATMRGGDVGTPAVVARPEEDTAHAFGGIAHQVMEALTLTPARPVLAGRETT